MQLRGNVRVCVVLAVCGAASLGLVGCGGGGGGGGGSSNPFAGSFTGSVTASPTVVGAFSGQIASDGAASIKLTITTLGTFTLPGTVSSSGGVTASTTVSGVTVTATGQLTLLAGGYAGSGTFSSSAGETGNWSLQSASGVSPFAGAYSGTYSGTEGGVPVSGTINGSISSGSDATLSFTSPSGTMTATGIAADNGDGCVTYGATPYPTLYAAGKLTQTAGSVTGTGTWESASGGTGTWTITRTP